MAKRERIRISNETLNCYGTWIRTAGVVMEQFKRNPVMLWMHLRGVIIGYVDDVVVKDDDITGVPVFDEASEESKRAKRQWEKGSLRMGSPHFEVLETSDAPELKKPGQTAPTITRAKLLEFSLVDIGGNDDNIRLSYAGEQLCADNVCDKLALAMVDNSKKCLTKMNDSKIQAIALMLGLPSECSLETLQKEVKSLLLAKSECETLRKKVQDLNGELKKLKSKGIADMVDEAIALGKLTADKREHFVSLGEQVGSESLKLTLEALRSAVKPGMLLNRDKKTEVKKWSDATEEELKLMREEDPETYKKLYREEFGIECVL